MMMTARTRDPEATRAAILDAAEEIFLAKGFGDAAMDQGPLGGFDFFVKHLSDESVGKAVTTQCPGHLGYDARLERQRQGVASQFYVECLDEYLSRKLLADHGRDRDHVRTLATTSIVDQWWDAIMSVAELRDIRYTVAGVESIRINEVMVRPVRRVEAEALTGEADMMRAARALADQGPREVVITHRDGIVVLADGQILEAPFHAQSMAGRSGRGDTCVGSYMAARLEHPPEEALLWSAATTSLKVEIPGPIRRPYEEIVHLVEESYKGALSPQ